MGLDHGVERGPQRVVGVDLEQERADLGVADPGQLARLGGVHPAEQSAIPGDQALAAAEAFGSDWVVVVAADRRLLGWVDAAEASKRASVGDARIRPFRLQVNADDSLRAALNAMVQSHTGVAVRVSDGERYEGLLTLELLSKEIS